MDDHKRRVILTLRAEGRSIRAIAAAVKVSVGVVHKTFNPAATPVDSCPPRWADRHIAAGV
ncbi:helix-turn-helix domain-containing protein [Streptomyces sp. SM14]|uniref:helix-turn-helix domain-containing protein n=1 Tax=Streptomyces sp. SM14 TaxID=1736045 RepID=UPI000CD4D1B5|nr:helix-turn-helix domain-containing protein [Streptomyces sp. SM14]